MIEGHKNKSMSGKSSGVKLKCVRECWAPGVGNFKEDEEISGSELVAQLKDNPNFIVLTEEA
jgi:hypothetical protein